MKFSAIALVSASLLACGAPLPSADGGDASARDSAVDGAGSEPDAAVDGAVYDPACESGGLEPDFAGAPLQGSAVDGSGQLAPGAYVLSTTRIRYQTSPVAQQRFQMLMGAMMPTLATAPGLLAVALGGSDRCATGRTLSVWRDEASMYAWVHGTAHQDAINSVSEVSRGGSRVTHWNGDATQAAWANAARVLHESRGPQY